MNKKRKYQRSVKIEVKQILSTITDSDVQDFEQAFEAMIEFYNNDDDISSQAMFDAMYELEDYYEERG